MTLVRRNGDGSDRDCRCATLPRNEPRHDHQPGVGDVTLDELDPAYVSASSTVTFAVGRSEAVDVTKFEQMNPAPPVTEIRTATPIAFEDGPPAERAGASASARR